MGGRNPHLRHLNAANAILGAGNGIVDDFADWTASASTGVARGWLMPVGHRIMPFRNPTQVNARRTIHPQAAASVIWVFSLYLLDRASRGASGRWNRQEKEILHPLETGWCRDAYGA